MTNDNKKKSYPMVVYQYYSRLFSCLHFSNDVSLQCVAHVRFTIGFHL